MISIIIPAFNASGHIGESLASINANLADTRCLSDVEVLIGVDGCQKTYECVKHLRNVFYFSKNVGPYVIRNTLVDFAKNENILFFDADDVMDIEAIKNITDVLRESDYARLKYMNFADGFITTWPGTPDERGLVSSPYASSTRFITIEHARKVSREIQAADSQQAQQLMNKYSTVAHCQLAIKKRLFNSLNGFYPWKCAADTEFINRLAHNNFKQGELHRVCFFRRLHGSNLTMRKSTGWNSPIRKEYANIIGEKTQSGRWNNPETKIIEKHAHATI